MTARKTTCLVIPFSVGCNATVAPPHPPAIHVTKAGSTHKIYYTIYPPAEQEISRALAAPAIRDVGSLQNGEISGFPRPGGFFDLKIQVSLL